MPDKRLIYEEPAELAQQEACRILSTGRVEEVVRALVSVALNESDYDFALKCILDKAADDDETIRGTAILCLGHLARIHRTLPDEPTVDVVRAGLNDQSKYVRGRAEDAAGDIEVFLPELGRLIRRSPHE